MGYAPPGGVNVTATGSTELWALAESLSIIPSPADSVLRGLLSSWWEQGRTFGCATARTGAWFVVMPDPSILCGRCAGERYATERRCAYCGKPVRVSRARTLVFEMGSGDIRVMGRGHVHCAEKAARKR